MSNVENNQAVVEQVESDGKDQDAAATDSAKKIYSKVFNESSANVVFKTSDSVIFRVDDFYLKASSGFFRDMLSSSTPSSSDEDPLPISEPSNDFEIMLLIITGRPNDAVNQPLTWHRAAGLYRMMDKYQLDGHQPWFSDICGRYVKEEPLEALFLACNRPCIDTTLARYAISDGISKKTAAQLYSKRYFIYDGWSDSTPGSPSTPYPVLAPTNMKAKFGLRLGFKGLIAYNLTFAKLKTTPNPDWHNLAIQFVDNARLIEQEIYNPTDDTEEAA